MSKKDEIEVQILPMRWEDGRLLTPAEEQAVKERVSRTFDEAFWKWEPARKTLYPLIDAWYVEGEECPDDLAAIIHETRELWKLNTIGADSDRQVAQVRRIEQLVREGFARRRDEA